MHARVWGPSATTLVVALSLTVPAVASAADATTLLSRPSGTGPVAAPQTGDGGLVSAFSTGGNTFQQVSGTGRYTVFVSLADGLSTEDDNRHTNVFVRDVQTNTTTFVSRATGASGAAADADALAPAISRDGRSVAFETRARLDPVNDTNSDTDVYLRNLDTNVTTLISASPTTGLAVGGRTAVVDQPGAFVAFLTGAPLDPVADTSPTSTDVYRRTVGASTQTLVSRVDGLLGAAAGSADHPSISDDGNRIAFSTTRTLLVPDDIDSLSSVFVRDVTGGTTELASRRNDTGTPGASAVEATDPEISGNGDLVAFISDDPNLVAGDTNGLEDAFLRDLTPVAGSETTVRISITPAGGQPTSTTREVDLAGAGGVAAFRLSNSVYVRPMGGTAIELVSRPSGTASLITSPVASHFSLSANGNNVAFSTFILDDDVSAEDDDLYNHVYLRRTSTATDANTTLYLDRPTGTAPFPGDGIDYGRSGAGLGGLSWDGRVAVFTSSTRFSGPDTEGADAAWVRTDGVTERVDLATEAATVPDAPGDDAVEEVVVSANGRTVAFTSDAENLDPAADPAFSAAYVRDRQTGVTEVVSRATGEAGAVVQDVDGHSLAISGNGRRVAFVTATSLSAQDTNTDDDVYVRDLDDDTTTLASVGVAGTSGNDEADEPALDWDGDVVAFTSRATDLVPDDTNSTGDVFVRDLGAGATALVSRTDAGAPAVGGGRTPSLSGDGDRVLFATGSSDLLDPSDDDGMVVRDRTTSDSIQVGGEASTGALSEDGRYALVLSDEDLGAPDTNLTDDVYRVTVDAPSERVLVSRATGAAGAPADEPSEDDDYRRAVSISPNGACASFSSAASNLDPNWVGTGIVSVFLREIGTCRDTVGPVAAVAGGAAGVTFTLDERRATATCTLDGAPLGACTSPLSLPPLAPGTHRVEVTGTDVVGNVGAPGAVEFTVDAPPVAATPAPVPTVPPPPVVPKASSKLSVLRAGVVDGKLDMLVEITGRASGKLGVAYESSGQTSRYSFDIAKAGRKLPSGFWQVKIAQKLPSAQQRKTTGIATITYTGDGDTKADEVRLRAASGKALLTRGTTLIEPDGDLVVKGTVDDASSGVVRVRLEYDEADGTPKTVFVNGKIATTAKDGKKSWSVTTRLPARAAATGGQLSIQFTGYEPRLVRGEQLAKLVTP